MSCENEKATTDYPGAIDSFPDRQMEGVICPQHMNWLQNAVVGIEQVLGSDPLADLPYQNIKSLLRDLFGLLPDPELPGEVGMDFSGLLVEDAGDHGVRIRCTEVSLFGESSETLFQEYSSVEVDADLTKPGAGGVQQGAVAGPNQWWDVNLLGDSSGAKPLAGFLIPATLGASSARPAGYDAMHRVGAIRTDSAGRIRQFLQVDNRVYYKDAQSAWIASSATGVWTRLHLDNLVSPYSREVMLLVRVSRGGGSGIANMNVRFPGAIGDRGLIGVQTGESGSDTDISTATVPTDAERAIEYRVGGQASPVEAEGIVVGYLDRYISSALD